jgi:decaprenyl-phosphate phosphoribosyltransferase
MKLKVKTIHSVFIAMRPKHWSKNGLVLALPLSDGVIIGSNFDLEAIWRALTVFISLSLISSANYILNDIRDREHDRRHEVKKFRPIASGEIGIPIALSISFILTFFSLAISIFFINARTCLLVLCFGIFQLLYTVFLKNFSGYDLVALSLLYVYRAVIPAAYEEIILSKWFLVIFFAAALFLASGKRYAELHNQGNRNTRKTLSSYSKLHLSLWIAISIAVLIISYINWIFSFAESSGFTIVFTSIIPIIVILIRVSYLTLSEFGEDPTKIVLHHKDNLILLVIWLSLYLLGKGYL